MDEDFLIANGKSLKWKVVYDRRSFRSLRSSPWLERVGELIDREDTLVVQSRNLKLIHSSQKAEVVLLLRLRVAAILELTSMAVIVEE